MGLLTAATAVAAIGGGVSSARSARKSAKAQQAGFDAATAEQRRQFDLARADLAPFRKAGVNALKRLENVSSGDFSDFFTSPGFEFVRDEGIRDIENTFSAKGSGGNALRRLAEFNSGLASNEFNNFFNRQLALTGVGEGATNVGVQAGQNTAANISNNLVGAGNARASGVRGVNDAFQGTLNNLLFLKGRRGDGLEEFDLSKLPKRRGLDPINLAA